MPSLPSRAPARDLWRAAAIFALGAGLGAGCLDWTRLQHGRCGDGFVGPEEQCDDANRTRGDGCSPTCQLEGAGCGNLQADEGEDCDDGNLSAGDGCDATCQVEDARCGDGRTDAGEECDDANASDADACVEDCQVARCGDSQLWEFVEQCDDGGVSPGDGCSPNCELEHELCGNGRLDAGETCDDTNSAAGDGCSAQCAIEPPAESCGNGVLDPNEVCDDGNRASTDLCLNGCSRATCGDGFVRQGVEECDDGNANSGDACTRACMVCTAPDGAHFRAGSSRCYTLHLGPQTQGQARAVCQAEGGDLWTVTSTAEGDDVIAKLGLDATPVWLGLTTKTTSIAWVTGEGTGFTAFDAGQPSDATLGCVQLVTLPDGSFRWRSEACASKRGFVCERAPAVVFAATHHAYRASTRGSTLAEAQAACVEQGGYLATFETDAERVFVGKAFNLVLWVGAGDAADEGRFLWSTGEAVDPAFFADGQPNDADGSADCLAMSLGDLLGDEQCDGKRASVCEFE